MKSLSIISITLGLLSLTLGIYCFLHIHITKVTTDTAVSIIQEKYLDKKLSEEDFKKYEWYKNWILSNEKYALMNLNLIRNTAFLGFSVMGIFLIYNGVSIMKFLKKNG